MNNPPVIREYIPEDFTAVSTLWRTALGYNRPHQDPAMAINLKLKQNDGLFLVAVSDNQVVGTIMGGFDGHRGWIYSLAVVESGRNQGIGTALLTAVIEKLRTLGCPKVNLQVIPGNSAVAFYEKAGFIIEDRISMGLKLK